MQKPGTCVLSPFSRVRLFATMWTVVHQAPLSLGFSRLDYRSGLPFPSAGNVPNPGIEPCLLYCRRTLLLSHQKPKYMATTSFWTTFFFPQKNRVATVTKKREGQPYYDRKEEFTSVLSGAKCEKERVKPRCNSFSDVLFPLWENDVVQLPLPHITAQRDTFLFLTQLLL